MLTLKKFLRRSNIIDIFLLGSMLKDKEEPRDIDIIVLFRENNVKIIGETLYEIKKAIQIEESHIEPIIIDNFFDEKIAASILHEGVSIKHGKKISTILNYNPFILFIFTLKGLNKVQKVRFAQSVYGRRNDGLLHKEKGKPLGKGAFMVPVEKEELFKEALEKHHVRFSAQRLLVNN